MKKRNQRIMSLLLISALSMSAMLAGCGSSSQESASADTKAETAAQAEAPESTAAESDTAADTADAAAESAEPGDNKLVIALESSPLITDYEDNDLTKYFEETLGIDLELQLLPSTADEIRTKVSLMVSSSEELPDVLITDDLTTEMILQYGMDGIFLPIQDYMLDADKMPNYNSIPDEDRELMTISSTMADGNMYSFPRYEDATWNMTPYRYYLNFTWLDALGLSVPTTTDELKEVLIAFRDQDPNGNGQKDEIPLYGYAGGTYGQNIVAALMNSFVYWNSGSNKGLALDASGENVIAPFTTEEWKEGLHYLNDLYNEGLLAPDIFTVDETQFKAVLNSETNVVGLVSAGSNGNWADSANNPNLKEMDMVEPFTGPKGVCYTPFSGDLTVQAMFIFSDSDKVDLAVKFADEHYNDYSARTIRYGQEGTHWTMEEDQLEGLTNAYVSDGLYDKITMALIKNIWNENNNVIWRNVGPRYMSRETSSTWCELGKEYDPNGNSRWNSFNMKYYNDKHPEKILPTLKYTMEESEQIMDATTNIPDYISQSIAEFVTGAKDIEADWDAYLGVLENMGLSVWLSAAQDAYERTLE